MLISERIFDLMKARGMTQKEFAKATGIAESTISDWKRKKTNPVSEKILTICQILQVTPYELLSGTDGQGKKSRLSEFIVVDKKTELGEFLLSYQKLEPNMQERILGYMKALCDMKR